jgi:hypothetical protein
MSEVRWVKLLEVNTRMEGEIIKEALEAQGIPAEIFQKGVNTTFPVTIGPFDGVDICVQTGRLEEAQAWLTEFDKGNLVDDAPEDAQS